MQIRFSRRGHIFVVFALFVICSSSYCFFFLHILFVWYGRCYWIVVFVAGWLVIWPEINDVTFIWWKFIRTNSKKYPWKQICEYFLIQLKTWLIIRCLQRMAKRTEGKKNWKECWWPPRSHNSMTTRRPNRHSSITQQHMLCILHMKFWTFWTFWWF